MTAESVTSHVPSPADVPQYTAEELLQECRIRGARVYRFREVMVFALTNSREVADWLLDLGGRPYLPHNAERVYNDLPAGAYRRERGGSAEWDIYIHLIPVRGIETIWEAAGRWTQTVEPTEFA
jgi:hypothetical protein